MKYLNLIIIGFLICIVGCAPITTTNIIKTYPPLDNNAEVRVFGLYEQAPKDSEVLGVVEVGKSDNRVKCTYEFVIATAKSEARKAGGNAIKIIEVDNRSSVQSWDLANLSDPKIFFNDFDKKLYVLSENKLYCSDVLLP